MNKDLEHAWKVFGLDGGEAAGIANRIAKSDTQTPQDRADALFLLGQIGRFMDPMKGYENLFWDALCVNRENLDSVLALCEVYVTASYQPDRPGLPYMLEKAEKLKDKMNTGQREQLEKVLRSLRELSEKYPPAPDA